MSKLSELDAVLAELSAHSQGVVDAAKTIRALLSVADVDAHDDEAPAPKAYTLDEVRSKLVVLTRNGYRDEVQELLRRHGAERLTNIPDSEYAAMMDEAEAIGK